MNKISQAARCLAVAGLLLSNAVLAGGVHYKVNTSTRFYTDDAANLAGVRMNWVYDPEVSAYILEGRDTSVEGLQQVAEDMLFDLHELSYFTQLKLNGTPLATTKASDYSVKLTDDKSLQLGLQLPLQAPIDIAGKTLSLTLADPDGTADMVYSHVDRIALDEKLAAKCSKPNLQAKPVDVGGHVLTIQTVSIACR